MNIKNKEHEDFLFQQRTGKAPKASKGGAGGAPSRKGSGLGRHGHLSPKGTIAGGGNMRA
eukprot:CAMPEP_0170490724 /NCGR_PEP_ID=MMETSP0208-20121228/8819_1 /TAXON_ID=197538 /ORGANISM="Strombidium inclinatum, Strain S3" /LENGTH=59 /DNA_ID=CAMNT_0010766165 /DNA_START=1160 /DNA_END=1339 /DNA_ORIENTATION=-